MKKLLHGLVALPFVAGVALAGQPTQLSDQQMDKVTAGFDFHEITISNTSWTEVLIGFNGALVPCSACYLSIASPPFSIQSAMQPTPNSPEAP